jgi:hypothetical protein
MYYRGEAITNDIVPRFMPYITDMKTALSAFILFCFVGLCLFRFSEMISAEEPIPFPWKRALGNLAICVLLIVTVSKWFPQIIAAVNYLADMIFGREKTEAFLTVFFPQNLWDQGDMGVLDFSAKKFIGWIGGVLAYIAFYVIGYIRYFLLSILFVFSPLAITMSMLPLFGFKYLMTYIVTIIQVASWAIFISILNLIMSNFGISADTGSIEFLTVMAIYVICLIMVPKIASALVGGNDFSAMAVLGQLAVGAGVAVMKGAGIGSAKFAHKHTTQKLSKKAGGLAKRAGGKAWETAKKVNPFAPKKINTRGI